MIAAVLAHAGGWDELMLFFVLPPVVFLIAYRMVRTESEVEEPDDPEPESGLRS